MKNQFKRNKYLNTNKYQRKIIGMTFAPTFIICGVMTALGMYFYHDLVNVILYRSMASGIQFINQWGLVALIIIWLLFFYLISRAYSISRDLVGPFGRINKELDDVIEGKSRKHIAARPGDDLAIDLLKRVNVLIDNVPETGKKLEEK